MAISAIVDFGRLKMCNFAREYPQGIERTGWGCIISMRSIRKAWKMWDVDAKFEKEVSSSYKKARCRCNYTC